MVVVPDFAPAATWVWPIQSFSAPALLPEIASQRAMPEVWLVSPLSSPARIWVSGRCHWSSLMRLLSVVWLVNIIGVCGGNGQKMRATMLQITLRVPPVSQENRALFLVTRQSSAGHRRYG